MLSIYHSQADCYRDKPPLEQQWAGPVAVHKAIQRLSIFTFHHKNIPGRINQQSGCTLGPESREIGTKARAMEGGLQ